MDLGLLEDRDLAGVREQPRRVRDAGRLDVVRLAVMVPLYLTGQVTALGAAKIVLGWPAYLLAVLVIGLLLLRGRTPLDDPDTRDARPATA